MNKLKTTKSKLLLAAIVLIALVIVIPIISSITTTQNKNTVLDSIYNTQNYFALVTSVEIDDEYTSNQLRAYTKDQGIVTFSIEENIPISFDFKTQYIYKDLHNKWNIYLKSEEESKKIPGSFESILQIDRSEIDLNKFIENTLQDRCEFLDIVNNCLGYKYEDSNIRHEIYFKKDIKTLVYLRTTYKDGSLLTHIFSKVNDQKYKQAAELFASYKAEVDADIQY